MRRFVLALVASVLSLLPLSCDRTPESRQETEADRITVADADWPWWRGPNRNGIAEPKQKPPTKWSATENVLWKSAVPGRGHGSPIVVGDQVFLATAEHDEEIQSVLCYHRQTGERLWKTVVHRGGFEKKGNKKGFFAYSCG